MTWERDYVHADKYLLWATPGPGPWLAGVATRRVRSYHALSRLSPWALVSRSYQPCAAITTQCVVVDQALPEQRIMRARK